MRDASFILRRAGSRVLAVMLLTAAAALGGCAGGGGAANSYAMAPSAGSGATVAFESIEGPPGSLGRCRRPRAAEDRPGRFQRTFQHDQRYTGCAELGARLARAGRGE